MAPYDVVTIAMNMGMDRVNAGMAVPMMWIRAATVDPYSPVVIMIVSKLQHKLALMGYPNRRDGFVDQATSDALRQLCGSDWKARTWLQIYGDVLQAAKNPKSPGKNTTMGYSGFGSVDDIEWCSKANVQGNCQPLSGLVKPMTIATANIFKNLQGQANRCAQVFGFSKIAVDGRIGSGTLSLVNKSAKKGISSMPLLGSLLSGWPNVESLARNADVAASGLKSIADSANAPAVVAGPASPSPSGTGGRLNPSNAEILKYADLKTKVMNSSLTLPVVAIGVIVGLYYYDKNRKGKKRAKGPSLLKGIF
jgi:hypothetical protein